MSVAGGFDGVAVGGVDGREVVELAGEASGGEGAVEGGEVEVGHGWAFVAEWWGDRGCEEDKYRGLSTARRTMMLSVASVEMTYFFGLSRNFRLGEVGGDAHAEVDGDGGVGEGADGDEVDPGEGVVADGLEVHVAGGLDGDVGQGGADLLDRLFDGGGGHVVEQDGLGAAGDGLVELDLAADLDLHDLAGLAAGEGVGEGGGKASAEGDVVVLDEDAVLQVEAVIDAAAAADGVLVEGAEAGDGLAGVEDSRGTLVLALVPATALTN